MEWWHVSGGGQQGCQRLLTYVGVCTVVHSQASSGVVRSSWVVGPRSASGVHHGLVLGGVGVLVVVVGVVVVVEVTYLVRWLQHQCSSSSLIAIAQAAVSGGGGPRGVHCGLMLGGGGVLVVGVVMVMVGVTYLVRWLQHRWHSLSSLIVITWADYMCIMCNPPDIHWRVLNNTMSLYNLCIYWLYGLKGLHTLTFASTDSII
jgi:hypothetical protein